MTPLQFLSLCAWLIYPQSKRIFIEKALTQLSTISPDIQVRDASMIAKKAPTYAKDESILIGAALACSQYQLACS